MGIEGNEGIDGIDLALRVPASARPWSPISNRDVLPVGFAHLVRCAHFFALCASEFCLGVIVVRFLPARYLFSCDRAVL